MKPDEPLVWSGLVNLADSALLAKHGSPALSFAFALTVCSYQRQSAELYSQSFTSTHASEVATTLHAIYATALFAKISFSSLVYADGQHRSFDVFVEPTVAQ